MRVTMYGITDTGTWKMIIYDPRRALTHILKLRKKIEALEERLERAEKRHQA